MSVLGVPRQRALHRSGFNEPSIWKTISGAFQMDPELFARKRELAKLVKAGHQAKIQAEANLKVDVVARAHGDPVTMLPIDWLFHHGSYQRQSWPRHARGKAKLISRL